MIRPATTNDLDLLEEMLINARNYMHTHGNTTQWSGSYPSRTDLEWHIHLKDLYVIEMNGEVEFAFVYAQIEEPNYLNIKGKWLNENPYAVIHLVFSRMRRSHLGNQMMEYVKNQNDDIRIDTHADNISMNRLIQNNGFQYTGIIYVEDGTPRNAYHWCRNLE